MCAAAPALRRGSDSRAEVALEFTHSFHSPIHTRGQVGFPAEQSAETQLEPGTGFAATLDDALEPGAHTPTDFGPGAHHRPQASGHGRPQIAPGLRPTFDATGHRPLELRPDSGPEPRTQPRSGIHNSVQTSANGTGQIPRHACGQISRRANGTAHPCGQTTFHGAADTGSQIRTGLDRAPKPCGQLRTQIRPGIHSTTDARTDFAAEVQPGLERAINCAAQIRAELEPSVNSTTSTCSDLTTKAEPAVDSPTQVQFEATAE